MAKDIAAIAAVILSPLIGALTGLWTYRRQTKERLSGAIIWNWASDHQGGLDEQPFLHIHNRSDRTVVITHLTYLRGSIWRRAGRGTAMEYVDPTDINFPYELEPGKMIAFKLDPFGAKAITDRANWFARIGRRLGRAPVWIEVRTMAGTRLVLRAEDATPWKDRADWLG